MLRVGCFVLAFGVVAVTRPAAAETACPTVGSDGQYHSVEEGLNWCSRDGGFNEGASCGVAALSGVQLPAALATALNPLLANAWRRYDMMSAARAAYHGGSVDAAVNTATCCQIHNPHMLNCLQSNRPAISNWFASTRAFDEVQARASEEYRKKGSATAGDSTH